MHDRNYARVAGEGEAVGLELIDKRGGAHDPERRRNLRLPLSFTVHVMRMGSPNAMTTTTVNMSCDGFYCYFDDLSVPFQIGETAACSLLMPAHDIKMPRRELRFQCQATVVRLDGPSGGRLGVAFAIAPGWQMKLNESYNPVSL
jgi:hypothetical protein